MLHLMQGIPGSGKSTVAAMVAQSLGAVIVNLDDIRAELFGDAANQSDPQRVMTIARDRVRAALMGGQSVILDATNVRRDYVDGWVALAAQSGHQTRIIRVVCPLDTALARNAARARVVPEGIIRRMHETLTRFDASGLVVIEVSTE